jgi:hypothetical protein
MRSGGEIVKDEEWGLPGEIDRCNDFGGRGGSRGLAWSIADDGSSKVLSDGVEQTSLAREDCR